jgi:hypothetical protein
MKVTFTSEDGAIHEAEAELTGINPDGDLYYTVVMPVDVATLRAGVVHVDELPSSSMLEVRAGE